MMALQEHAVTAAHWSAVHYERIFALPASMPACPGPHAAGQKPVGHHQEGDGLNPASSAPERARWLSLVVEGGGGVEGFLVSRVVGGEWEIENIVVVGPARRMGLGTRLLSEFLDLARHEGARTVFLEVRESNRAARALYEKWAFVQSGRRKRYYRNPAEDAIVYRLRFA
jgi:ribosomal-protein-alanine acetyltransferase